MDLKTFGRWLYFLSLYAVSFYSLSAEIKKMIFKTLNALTIYDYFDLDSQNPIPGDMEFKILVDGFLVYKIKNFVFITSVWE